MDLLYFALMALGGLSMCSGFYWTGERRGWNGWAGIVLLFAGFVLTFLGLLLAFAPGFFI